mmetsp:Transcript_51336/g.109903  ORF Transcript_51336/g.109903 Transcript_51336/m.109903 type:complete len:249 (-) Transcript_51336:270-1016(-)
MAKVAAESVPRQKGRAPKHEPRAPGALPASGPRQSSCALQYSQQQRSCPVAGARWRPASCPWCLRASPQLGPPQPPPHQAAPDRWRHPRGAARRSARRPWLPRAAPWPPAPSVGRAPSLVPARLRPLAGQQRQRPPARPAAGPALPIRPGAALPPFPRLQRPPPHAEHGALDGRRQAPPPQRRLSMNAAAPMPPSMLQLLPGWRLGQRPPLATPHPGSAAAPRGGTPPFPRPRCPQQQFRHLATGLPH